jgi:CBS domain-containing protein
MTTPAITVGPDATFGDIVDLLLVHEISGLPVVDGEGRLLGIVTEADLVSKEAYGHRRRRSLELLADYLRGHDPQWVRKAGGRTASEVMTTSPAFAAPGDDVAVAARRMLEGRHKRLPVVDGGRVVGIVSRRDLLTPLHRSDDAIGADLRAMLADPLRVPERLDVETHVAHGVVTLSGAAEWPSDVRVLEAVVAGVPGVVAVDSAVTSRQGADPSIDRIYRSDPQHRA